MATVAGCIATWCSDQDRVGSIPGFADPVSSLTHLVAAAVFTVAAIRLLRRGVGSRGRVALVVTYSSSIVLLFSMSGVFHLLAHGTSGRTVLQRLDHACIFVLIAGTFTAVHGLLFRGWLRWGVITVFWVATATAIPLKTVFFSNMPEWLSLALYLGPPWLGVGSWALLWRRHGLRFAAPIAWGGLAYSVGAVMDFMRWPNPWPGVVHAHELFHLAVILGAWLHWRFCAAVLRDTRMIPRVTARRRPPTVAPASRCAP